MDKIWFNRELVDNQIEGIDFKELNYDPDTGQYCYNGEPFTGVSKLRDREGKRLESIAYHKDGVEQGVSVSWYPNGQIEIYAEMDNDVSHGWYREWDEDGTLRVEQHYTHGRPS